MDAASAQTTSDIFSAPDADVTYLSSDRVLFKLHAAHLNSNSRVLFQEAAGNRPVHLPEAAEVLEVLFQFIEPPPAFRRNRQPSVLDIEPGLFFAVSEASEKYRVYAAMNICVTRMAMANMASEYPFQILNHCVKYGYSDMADGVAEKSLSQPLSAAVHNITSPDVLRRWILYYEKWRQAGRTSTKILVAELNLEFTDQSTCYRVPNQLAVHLSRIDRDPSLFDVVVNKLQDQCSSQKCDPCKYASYPTWKDGILALRKDIPKFSDI